MYIFTFFNYQTQDFQLELLDLLKSNGFKAWLERDGSEDQLFTDANLKEIDWISNRRNFFKTSTKV